MTPGYRIAWFCLLAWISSAAVASAGDDSFSFKVAPERVQIGTFYHGSELEITAQIPQYDAAVIILKGTEDKVILNRKGKVASIWLNVGKLTVYDAPHVYILAASCRLANIASAETLDRLGIGRESLRKQIKFTSDKPLSGNEFDEFLDLKSSNGVYDTTGQIDLLASSDGGQNLSAQLSIPPATPPGNYKILFYLFNQGELVRQDTAQISLERTGLVRMLTDLSSQSAAAYGLLAILVALVAGIMVGVIFSSLSR